MELKNLSEHFSLQAFLNSYLRDYAGEDTSCIQDSFVHLSFQKDHFRIGLKQYSLLGMHQYDDQIFFNDKKITFKEFVERVVSYLCPPSYQEAFSQRVEKSRLQMQENFNSHPTLNIKNYIDSEKKLLKGHPFHPYPKSKEGMSSDVLQSFSPEQQGLCRFIWLTIHDSLYVGNIPLDSYKQKIEPLAHFEKIQSEDNHFLLPIHPWQWKEVQKIKTLDFSKVLKVSEGEHDYHVLSSMRSFYHESSPLLLKTSLNIRLTNSIRTLQVKEAERGKEAEEILKSVEAPEGFSFLGEPFFATLKDDQGKELNECIVQFRDNFSLQVDKSQTFLLSSLVENHPIEQKSLALQMIQRLASCHQNNLRLARKFWFKAFLERAIKPFLTLACQEGILLGAHMQNILVQTKDDLPIGVIYRDFQGSGFTKRAFEKYKANHPSLRVENGNILDQDEVNKVFGYYLIVNTVFSTISSLASSSFEIEQELLTDFRTFLHQLKNTHSDPFYDFLLNSPSLYQKGNMRCCLENINENTDDSPWRIYNKIKNPLLSLRKVEDISCGTRVYQAQTIKGDRISLRKLQLSDLDLFFSWHHKKFVSEFWELNYPKEELLLYMKEVIHSPYQLPLIVELNEEPMGYFETYWAYDDRIAPYCNPNPYDRGIHLLIGEERFLKTHHVYDAILHGTKYLLEAHPKTTAVWGEPRSDNKKIMKFVESLPGWRFLREFDFPHKRANLIKCDKDLFYQEYKHAP